MSPHCPSIYLSIRILFNPLYVSALHIYLFIYLSTHLFKDMDLVMADPWCVGYFKEGDGPARRLCRALCFVRTPGGPMVGEGPEADLCDNGFARPVEGLIVRVDLQKMEVR